MKYDILTDTAFFKAVQNGNFDEATARYGEFIERVVSVCSCTDGKPIAFATLSYTEVELSAVSDENPKMSIMVEKVLSFIHNMQKMVELCLIEIILQHMYRIKNILDIGIVIIYMAIQ